jgi:hypothetical protein
VLTTINGVRFCAKIADTYQDTAHPIVNDDGTWRCPGGTLACDPNVGPENIMNVVCVKEASDCPITGISFEAQNSASWTGASHTGATVEAWS